MAFSIRNLSVLAYANGFTLWHYRTRQDALAAVTAPDYFGGAADMLTTGDMLMATANDNSKIVVVTAVDACGLVQLGDVA